MFYLVIGWGLEGCR